MRAAIRAGATLDELEKWVSGGYEPAFMAQVIAWYRADGLIAQHAESARMGKRKKR